MPSLSEMAQMATDLRGLLPRIDRLEERLTDVETRPPADAIGASLYEINAAGEAEINEGPEGPAGPQGPEGFQGPEGPEGKQGKEGPEGKQGKEGPEGGSIEVGGGLATIYTPLLWAKGGKTRAAVRLAVPASASQIIAVMISDGTISPAGTGLAKALYRGVEMSSPANLAVAGGPTLKLFILNPGTKPSAVTSKYSWLFFERTAEVATNCAVHIGLAAISLETAGTQGAKTPGISSEGTKRRWRPTDEGHPTLLVCGAYGTAVSEVASEQNGFALINTLAAGSGGGGGAGASFRLFTLAEQEKQLGLVSASLEELELWWRLNNVPTSAGYVVGGPLGGEHNIL